MVSLTTEYLVNDLATVVGFIHEFVKQIEALNEQIEQLKQEKEELSKQLEEKPATEAPVDSEATQQLSEQIEKLTADNNELNKQLADRENELTVKGERRKGRDQLGVRD